jgi:hypothetical protein
LKLALHFSAGKAGVMTSESVKRTTEDEA